MTSQPAVFYAVLNWGLGHASRSIPLITALLKKGFHVHIASDGYALDLLSKTFPELPAHSLPSLEISYQKSGKQQLAILQQSADLMKWYKADGRVLENLLKTHNFSGIISDNRPGICSKQIPSVYLTHQVSIKAGLASPMASLIHRQLYKNFDQVWIPDNPDYPGLAGDLSHNHTHVQARYIGPLSDLNTGATQTQKYDLAVILSGPEPQRSLFEEKVFDHLAGTDKQVLLVRGTKKERLHTFPSNWDVIDFAGRDKIKEAFIGSKMIIARCGYSTLMDLYHYPKPALLVPTPGQPEQEYLATLAPHKENFAIQSQLERIIPPF
jgi:UDP:flavonoid glycosyltransferase YjiC (YdhE family)